jgi:hypothetical protein
MNILKHDFDSSSELLQAGLLLNQLEDLIGFISTNEFGKPQSISSLRLRHLNLWFLTYGIRCVPITEVHFFRDMDSNW